MKKYLNYASIILFKTQSDFLKYKKETILQMKQLYYLILLKTICSSSMMLFRDFTGKTPRQLCTPFLFTNTNEYNENLESQSLCFVSDHWKCNQSAVHSFLVIASYLFVKSQPPFVLNVIYLSNGAASPYKNYKAFINLCFHEQNHSLKTELHFFCKIPW